MHSTSSFCFALASPHGLYTDNYTQFSWMIGDPFRSLCLQLLSLCQVCHEHGDCYRSTDGASCSPRLARKQIWTHWIQVSHTRMLNRYYIHIFLWDSIQAHAYCIFIWLLHYHRCKVVPWIHVPSNASGRLSKFEWPGTSGGLNWSCFGCFGIRRFEIGSWTYSEVGSSAWK